MTYVLNEDARLTASIKDVAAALADPTTVEIEITNPDGTEAQAATAMTNLSTGEYVYFHTLLSAAQVGKYTYEVIATGSAGKVTIERDTFIVKA
ncbi:MAG: hypothetical protein KAJ03_07040 [Gammaproteobacteria bacterium]|nr:hypothetical protein [Gammaproteobacteria bacterium]